MTNIEHLFISPNGSTLPGWLDAFAHARSSAIEQFSGPVSTATLVWLRLDQTMALDAQVAALRALCGHARLIVLSDLPNDGEALAALAAQARGYCNSHAGAEVLGKVASVVSQGGLWIGETLMHRILSVQQQIKVPESAARPDWRAALTAREIEVAELAAAGERYKDIARQLYITERTVKSHMAGILDKLGLRDRLQLALLASERQHTQTFAL
ncbi:MAG: response regulator transcription factor [Pseudomonadota bacterium]